MFDHLTEILYRIGYVVSRLLPILIFHYISSNIYHSFLLTMLAEFIMSLDDVGIISYHSSKIIGGTIFGIEKLMSYYSYTFLTNPLILIVLSIFSYGLYCLYPTTERTNILYMTIVLLWTISSFSYGSMVQILGVLIYGITDYDVAMHDSKNFGIFLLPVYQLGLFLLAIG